MKKYIGYTLVLAMVMASTTYADKGSETSRFKDLFGVKDRQEQRGSDDRDNETETEVEHGTTTQKVREEKRAQSGEKSVQTLDEARARAIKEIDQRIEAMNKLAARIAAMTRVSDAAKASIKATVDAQIASLTSLKTTIQSATDAIVLKEQAQTITKAYRIYMLVMPQLQIAAAADKIKATGELLTTMAGKGGKGLDPGADLPGRAAPGPGTHAVGNFAPSGNGQAFRSLGEPEAELSGPL
jgi:hypothetical protein